MLNRIIPVAASTWIAFLSFCAHGWPMDESNGTIAQILGNVSSSSQGLNSVTRMSSFEDVVEQAIPQPDREGYTTYWLSAESRNLPTISGPSDLTTLALRMLDRKKRKTLYKLGWVIWFRWQWSRESIGPFIPDSSHSPTWYWKREKYTMKQAFGQLEKCGIKLSFWGVVMKLNLEDPSAGTAWWQVGYLFVYDKNHRPPLYYGVGATNGIVWNMTDTGEVKILLQGELVTMGETSATNQSSISETF